MKRLLYITPVPSPFQIEFIKYCNTVQNKIEVIPVYITNLEKERITWGDFSNYDVINGSVKIFYKMWKRYKPDVVAMTGYANRISWLALSLCKAYKIPYIYGPSEKLIRRKFPLNKIKESIIGIFLSNARGIVGIGNGAVEEFRRIAPDKPIINIPYSFSLEKLLKNENKIEGAVKFIYSGRLVDFRNPVFTIEVFASLVEKYDRKVHLIISGIGPLKENCIQKINDLGLNDYVTWDLGYKDWYDVHNLYSKGNVLLALQKYSGWGLIIQEAMAAGLGIIGSRYMEAVNTLMKDSINGFVVSLNKDEIINKASIYIDNPEIIIKHGNRAKLDIQQYDVTRTSKEYMDFIISLL
jgi:glycosyltransferase involved in cell wall biosynthesis